MWDNELCHNEECSFRKSVSEEKVDSDYSNIVSAPTSNSLTSWESFSHSTIYIVLGNLTIPIHCAFCVHLNRIDMPKAFLASKAKALLNK